MSSSDNSVFDGFDPMSEDHVKALNSNYFGGPGFALPNTEHGLKPINILVENIPEDLKREGLIRAFRIARVLPVSCKYVHYKGSNKAILNVKSINDATSAIQALNNRPPLNLKVTLAANQEDYENKRNQIQVEQRKDLAKHLRYLGEPLNRMGELVSNICTVENLFKVLSTRDEICNICSSEIVIRHVHFIVSDEQVIDPFKGLPESEPVRCAFCKTEDGKFIVCGDCLVTAYCGIRCQSLGWTAHKNSCVPYPKLTNGNHLSPVTNTNDLPVEIEKPSKVKDTTPIVGVSLNVQSGPNGQPALKVQGINVGEGKQKAQTPEIPKESTPKPEKKIVEQEPEIVKIPASQKESTPKPERKIVAQEPKKVPEIVAPVKKASPPPSPLSPPRPKVTNNIDDSDFKLKPFNGRVNNPANSIEEPNKIIRPRTKISLNNEVSFIRETKLDSNSTIEIIFSFCYSPSEFYIQRAADAPEAEAVTLKLEETCGQSVWPEARKLKVGNYCAAKFPEDECWYRAKVLSFKGEKRVEVKFIDYGNRAFVEFEDLSPLPPELVAIPALAVRGSLKFIKPIFEGSGWSREASKFFEDCLTDDVELPFNHCKIFNEFEGVHHVELFNAEGEKLNDLMVQKGYAVRYEEIRKPIGPRMRRNPDLSKSPPPLLHKPAEPRTNHSNYEGGTNGVVKPPYEEKKPIISGDSGVKPRFEKEKIDDRNEIRVEPPVQRKPCPENVDQPKSNKNVVEVSPPRPPPVKDISPGEAYKNNCLSKSPASYYHLYPMGTVKEDEAVLLYNDVEDPSIVYVLGNNDSMLQLCNELGTIEETGRHVEPKPGTFVVAPADDGDYYRVLVLDVVGDKSKVFYLDFGNQDLVDNDGILKLPSKINLTNIPAQGIRCRIDNMDKIENFETRLADRIAAGSPAEIKVVRKISDHEYAIEITF